MSRVRLLWWPDLSVEKVRFDNQQFTNIHLSTMDNLKEFRDIFGKSFGVGVKKKARQSDGRLFLLSNDSIQAIDRLLLLVRAMSIGSNQLLLTYCNRSLLRIY